MGAAVLNSYENHHEQREAASPYYPSTAQSLALNTDRHRTGSAMMRIVDEIRRLHKFVLSIRLFGCQ